MFGALSVKCVNAEGMAMRGVSPCYAGMSLRAQVTLDTQTCLLCRVSYLGTLLYFSCAHHQLQEHSALLNPHLANLKNKSKSSVIITNRICSSPKRCSRHRSILQLYDAAFYLLVTRVDTEAQRDLTQEDLTQLVVGRVELAHESQAHRLQSPGSLHSAPTGPYSVFLPEQLPSFF